MRPHSHASSGTVRVELSVLGVEPGAFTVYGWHNMTFVVWSGAATAASVAHLDRLTALTRERHPQGLSAVHIVRGQVALPSTEARQGLVRLTNDYGDWLAAVAVVIGGSGFWASTMRSVVTAMRMLGSRAFEMRIHGTVDEVVEWLPAVHFKKSGVQVDGAELLIALRQAESTEAVPTS
jgi:hypothetical protein